MMYTESELENIQFILLDKIDRLNKKTELKTIELLKLSDLKELFYKTKSQIK